MISRKSEGGSGTDHRARMGRCPECGERSLYIKRASGLCPRCELKGQGGVRRNEAQSAEAGTLLPDERARLLDAILSLIRDASNYLRNPVNGYLSLAQLYKYSGLSEHLVRRLIQEHGLPAYRVGRRVLVSKAEFDQWLKSHRLQPSRSLADELSEIGFDSQERALRRRRR
jgi:excisionase family DNA binding protein